EAEAYDGLFPPARYPVRLYKVRYPSVVPQHDNKPTIASGLVAVPVSGETAMPVVSYQHGTVFDANYVPSRPDQSAETRIMVARFASQGYAVIAADYFGRGDSDLPDAYVVKGSAQEANYDMLIAAKSVLVALGIDPGKLFLSGWSQGGWTTMAYLEKLEGLGLPVTAAAVASGPVDIALPFGRWLNNPQPVDAPYLPAAVAILLHADASYHQVPGLPESAIAPEYVGAARAFYEGTMDFDTFFAQTTPSLQAFTRPEFQADIAASRGAFWQRLDERQAYRWKYATPVRTWYGGADEVTPIMIGQLPEHVAALLGGAETTAIDAGATADHRGVFIRAVLEQKDWFDSLLDASP
ncbi:MAG: alpha/beta fold hydrolase, partial [Rhizobiales bacterium]|nr:alpha/beta fold hydrolase [Hyphomicrobiales bacterium]